jgi:hypothetical protein
MQWSKLKARIKALICPELSDRIDLHLTSYRHSHDGADKLWVTVDGNRVFDCKHYRHEVAEVNAYSIGLRDQELKTRLRDQEIHSPAEFGSAIKLYPCLSIDEALASDDPIIKAFAMVDRRLGKRRLAMLELSVSEHSLVKTFYSLRLSTAHIQRIKNSCGASWEWDASRKRKPPHNSVLN